MDPPLDKGQTFTSGVTTGQRRYAWQRPFATAIDIRRLHDQRITIHLEPAEHVGAADLEYEWLISQDEDPKFFIWQLKYFVDGVAIKQDL